MQTPNGPNVCPKCNSDNIANDARNVSKKSNAELSASQVELLAFVNVQDAPELVKSLKWVHDAAIYHSHLFIEAEEKSMLHDVKILIDRIADIGNKV